MSDEMTVLRQKEPAIAEFLDDWRSRYEHRQFDFSNETDQADFYEAMTEMARHVAQVAGSATLSSLVSVSGVDTLYLKAAPKTS